MSDKRKYRVTPSENAGYAPGQYVVQYYDPNMRVWFDMGEPKSHSDALSLVRLYRNKTTDSVEE